MRFLSCAKARDLNLRFDSLFLASCSDWCGGLSVDKSIDIVYGDDIMGIQMASASPRFGGANYFSPNNALFRAFFKSLKTLSFKTPILRTNL